MKEYENFLFFGKWKILLDALDEQTAKECLWQIVKYGTEGEIDTDNPLIEGIIEGTIAENIKHSQARYNSAIKGGRPKKNIDVDKLMFYINAGKTYEECAEIFGVSPNTIGRRVREYQNTKTNQNPPNTKTITQEEEVKEKEKEEVKTSSRDDFAMLMGLEV